MYNFGVASVKSSFRSLADSKPCMDKARKDPSSVMLTAGTAQREDGMQEGSLDSFLHGEERSSDDTEGIR